MEVVVAVNFSAVFIFTTVSDSCQVSGNNPGKGIVKGLNYTAVRTNVSIYFTKQKKNPLDF